MKFCKFFLFLLFLSSGSVPAAGEEAGVLPPEAGHPRYLTTPAGKETTWELIRTEPWAGEVFRRLRERTDAYVERGEEWLVSRLQMYWKTHATEVFIRGEYFDHAGGAKAPAPPRSVNRRACGTTPARADRLRRSFTSSCPTISANRMVPLFSFQWPHAHHRPVDPKPPSPREESDSSSTGSHSTRS